MKAEIIAVGTELLLGQITNTNAQFLSQELANLGIDVYFQTVVGDNEMRLKEAFNAAQKRADLVICTGGLGPTQDDLTKDVLASLTDSKLLIHQPSMDKIQHLFDQRGMHMVDSNKRQALIIENSHPFFNEVGLAVGIAMKYGDSLFVLLPGPPREMKVMFNQYTKPWLQSLTKAIPLHSKTLKFVGIGESTLEHKLEDLIRGQQDPTIAPYAKEGEVSIRLTTRASSAEEAENKMRATETEIRNRLGKYLFADEDVSLEHAVVRLMAAKNLTLSSAESCTGGMLSDLITSIPGSSDVFQGGIICYSNELKHRLLQVPNEILEGPDAPGAISSETAQLLAEHLLEQTNTDFSLAITGVAGPSSLEDKPVGLVYIGIAQKGQETHVKKVELSGNREIIKLRASKYALHLLWLKLKEN